ncbi:MAG: intradiol ring-cleavage dioxygenase [Alphaproteobacteria bacterium]|nr:intradiol ring-cleavage dioxygenase [Alphaproteobacteria bacterium]
MSAVTIENITEVFEQSISPELTGRRREVLMSLVRHLHDFCREVQLTHEEWLVGIDFLTRAGQMTDDKRNEFILVCDVLGIESLVDAISHVGGADITESSVLGPFYRPGAPQLDFDGSISQRGDVDGESVRIAGRVTDPKGQPIAGATVDVWETGPDGLYEQQDAAQPDMNLRGVFRTRADGRYSLRAVRPVSYPIPYDGPAGDILQIMGRHPYRPAHVHMIVKAPGFQPLVSQIYDTSDEYIGTDSVYAVKGSLMVDFERAPEGSDVRWVVTHDIVLNRAAR